MPTLGALFFVPSYNGSTRLVTNSLGVVVSRIEYKPYGEQVKNAAYSNGPDNFRHKYTGQEHDSETNLSYYGARYYDQALGRFITQDIMFDPNLGPKGYNRYMYVGGNPIQNYDPFGGNAFSDWWTENITEGTHD